MVCVPKAALIPDGDLTWLGGLGLEAAAGLNRRQKEALVDMRLFIIEGVGVVGGVGRVVAG